MQEHDDRTSYHRWKSISVVLLLALSLRCRSQPTGDHLFRLCSNQTIDQFSVFKDQHRRNAGDLILARDLWIFVDVEFGDSIAAL